MKEYIVGIIAIAGLIISGTALAGAGIIYSQNLDVMIIDVGQWHEDNGHLFVSQTELADAHKLINDAIAAPHIEIQNNEDKILLNRQSINDLKIEIAKLKNQNTGTGTPSQGTITVSVAETCYEKGDVITFEGMATPSRQLTSSIYPTQGGKSVFEASPTTNTNSNGSFQLYWVIPESIDAGSYVAKLSDSGGKVGQITVSVRISC